MPIVVAYRQAAARVRHCNIRRIMRLLTYAFGFIALAGCATAAVPPTAAQLRPEVEVFIGEMMDRHGFSRAELESIFSMAEFQPAINNTISQPATSRPWYEFRPI